jgi:hypothetical protein
LLNSSTVTTHEIDRAAVDPVSVKLARFSRPFDEVLPRRYQIVMPKIFGMASILPRPVLPLLIEDVFPCIVHQNEP